MNENENPRDEAIEKELDGVPEEFLAEDNAEDTAGQMAQELAALREELATAKQEVLYAKADTQNVRRRLEKDMADARAYAATAFARDILSVADNLARALQAIPGELREDGKMQGLVSGIEATQREMDKVFSQHGISRIAAKGLPLDPNQHQAMMEIPSDTAEPGTVVDEMQAGYMIKDRLLRPAMVVVAKKPD
ncbi:nucleotide exchange factor GrpE [Altererythrobacter sp. B11]|uniref:nucleotide exchange factor GrpE n=1 Tax=Altererythrobacter sp. B11 TaxID=2060312 RepID=UPI000DC73839|nr:nucleotide exchange factor GrpE [Altererythrobacter sp. B11]BBC73105.1 nucleotide exchange factor GrpE [Altererythrobacter sp. B11]